VKFTEFPPAPAGDQPRRKLAKHDCLSNSLNMAQEIPGLRYAEGIAKSDMGLWYRHAWNVNDAGEAVDYTWRETGQRYLGRVIDTDTKWADTMKRELYLFEDEQPYVPDGELGLGCHTREQAEWIREQMTARKGVSTSE